MPVGRPTLYSQQEFFEAWQKAKSINHLAEILDLSLNATYRYLNRFNYPSPSKERDEKHMAIFNAYKGHATVRSLSEFHDTAGPSIVNSLQYTVRRLWHRSELPPILPEPMILQEIKLYHALVENQELFDEPDVIATETNVPVVMVRDYLSRAFIAMANGPNYPEERIIPSSPVHDPVLDAGIPKIRTRIAPKPEQEIP